MKKYFFILFPIAFICMYLHAKHLESTITEQDIKNYTDYEDRRMSALSNLSVIDELEGPSVFFGPTQNVYSSVVFHKYKYPYAIELLMGLWYLALFLTVIRYIFIKIFKRNKSDDTEKNNEQEQ